MDTKSTKNSDKRVYHSILLIEDELVILETISEILSDLGYQVLRASDGIEACNVFDQNMSNIDLVIVDYTLPKRSGVEVVQYIQSKRNEIKIILCSGRAQSEINHDFLEDTNIQFLAKPYEITQIVGMVEESLK